MLALILLNAPLTVAHTAQLYSGLHVMDIWECNAVYSYP